MAGGEFSSEAAEELESLVDDGGWLMICVILTLMVGFVFGNFLHKKHWVFFPESLMFVVLGAVLGCVLPMKENRAGFVSWSISEISIQEVSAVNKTILNWFLLPIIIFEAGWSTRHKDFMSQFTYILFFAIFGTILTMALVGLLVLTTSPIHGITQPRVVFAYAALISAVDPVATLATYAHLNVEPMLNTLVFGESVINDAVAIVLFHCLNDPPVGYFDNMSMREISGKISLGVLVGLSVSLGLGVLMGTIYILVLRFGRMVYSPSLQILFIYLCCYLTYAVTELCFHQSGIIAVLFCGMLMSEFATPHLNTEGNLLVSFLLKQMASLADAIVFLFVGLAVVFVNHNGLLLGLYMMLACLIGRAVAVFPIGLLCNAVKRFFGWRKPEEKMHLLSWQHMFMIFLAGLRGGIALVLTLDLGSWVDEMDGLGTKEQLRNATLVVICGFLLLLGGSTECTLKRLGIPYGGDAEMEHYGEKGWRCVGWVKKKILMPILVGEISPELGDDGMVINEVLHEAANTRLNDDGGHDVEAAAGLGAPKKRNPQLRGNRFRYFGTADPTHLDEVTAARRRGSRACCCFGRARSNSESETSERSASGTRSGVEESEVSS